MKAQEEILARARAIVSHELERRLAASVERLPQSCHFNHRQPLDIRRLVEGQPNRVYNTITASHGQTIGLCMLGAEKVGGHWAMNESDSDAWNGTICEDPIDAQRCPYFKPSQAKEEVVAQFQRELEDSEWLLANLPELATLLWVLDSKGPPRLNWWQRLLVYFRRTRPAPLLVRPDLVLPNEAIDPRTPAPSPSP